jgi:hypothetical protein
MNDINPSAMKDIVDLIYPEDIQVICLNGVKIEVKEELNGIVQCEMDNFATNIETIRAIWRIYMLKKVTILTFLSKQRKNAKHFSADFIS